MASGEASKIWRNRRSARTTSRAPGSCRAAFSSRTCLAEIGRRKSSPVCKQSAAPSRTQFISRRVSASRAKTMRGTNSARLGLAGQNDERDQLGACAQGFQCSAPAPAGGCVFRHYQIVPGAIEDGGQILRFFGGGMARVETRARQFAHAMLRDFGLGLKK